MTLSSCSDCGQEIPEGVIHCPYCPTGLRTGRIVRDLALILVFLATFVYLVARLMGAL